MGFRNPHHYPYHPHPPPQHSRQYSNHRHHTHQVEDRLSNDHLQVDDEDDDSMTTKKNKRSHGDAFPTEAELSLMSKPERKRHREKRRRDRVNASFDKLRSLLIRVDPQCASRVDISQLELVDRSVVIIQDLFDEVNRYKDLLKKMSVKESTHKVQESQGARGKTSAFSYSAHSADPFEIEPAAAAQQPHTHPQFYPPRYGDHQEQVHRRWSAPHHFHDGEDHAHSPYVHHSRASEPIPWQISGARGGGGMSLSSQGPTLNPHCIAPITRDYSHEAYSGHDVTQELLLPQQQQQQRPKSSDTNSEAATIDLWSAFSEPIHSDEAPQPLPPARES